jgi:hypothetical protein
MEARRTGLNGFNTRIAGFLSQASARRIPPQGLEEVYRLRYAAYLREGAIEPNPLRRFADSYDDSPNVWTFGVYLDGVLASSIRMHVGGRESPGMPALQVFGHALRPELDSGKTIIDPTRFVTDVFYSRRYPELPYATVRLAWMACAWFDAQMLLATVRIEHQAFYRRLFGHRVLVDAVAYPGLKKPISLMSVDYEEARARVVTRYPFLESSPAEREALFGTRSADVADPAAGPGRALG